VAPLRTRSMAIGSAPSVVRSCRRLVAELLGAVDEEVADRVLLCASELVTNAIEHAEPPAGLRVAVDDDRVRIEVDDSTERLPALRHPDASSIRGRGMAIVQRCSDRWGIVARPGGKTVWCEVALVDVQRARRRPIVAAPPR
jgi:anti-sigma regulatory factor (Ser/Thr protein kinase)